LYPDRTYGGFVFIFTNDRISILADASHVFAWVFFLLLKHFLTLKTIGMKTKITKRDLIAFILGAVVMILIRIFADLQNNVKNFRAGFNEGYNNAMQENTR